MKLNYDVFSEKKEKQTEKPLKTKTALSMQATLENAMIARNPQGRAGQAVTPTANANGFGRSV